MVGSFNPILAFYKVQGVLKNYTSGFLTHNFDEMKSKYPILAQKKKEFMQTCYYKISKVG